MDRLIRVTAGQYRTDDGRYIVERDDAFGRMCNGPHPTLLPRDEWTWDTATGQWQRSYQCPGGVTHRHVRWHVLDTRAGDYLNGTGPGEFATLTEAAAALGFTGPAASYIRR